MRKLCSSIAAVTALVCPANAQTGPSEAKAPAAQNSDEIPAVATITGVTYQRVKLIQRDGGTVRFMHSGGIKTLNLSEFDQASAKLLGATEHQEEIRAAAEAAKATAAEQKRRSEEMALKRKAFVEALQAKKVKELEDWAFLTALENPSATVETVKKVVGRPPDYQSGDEYFSWSNACWNPTTEKLDNLVLKRELRIVAAGNQPYPVIIHTLECGRFAISSEKLNQMLAVLPKALEAIPVKK